MVEPRISPERIRKDKIVIWRRKVEPEWEEEKKFLPVKVDGEEFLPSTATWRAYCGEYEEAINLFLCVRDGYFHSQNDPEDDPKDDPQNDPDYRVFYNLAFCYHAIEMYQDAWIEIQICTFLNPNFFKGWFLKCQILSALKRYQESENVLLKLNRKVEGCDREVRNAIKSNIFDSLINDGYDEERAGFGSENYPNILQAKHAIQDYERNMAVILMGKIKRYELYWRQTRKITHVLWKNYCKRKWKEVANSASSCSTS